MCQSRLLQRPVLKILYIFVLLMKQLWLKIQFVYLITNDKDAMVLNQINRFPKTLPELNLKMQTGIIVDFRTREVLRDQLEDGAYPLIYSQHIQNGRVTWPLGKESEVIKTDRKGFLQENSDFLMVKRFTSKEEERRLQCGIYLKQKISTIHIY